MTTIVPKNLCTAKMTGSIATYYTVPANTKAIIKAANVSNDTGSTGVFVANLVPTGGTADDTNVVSPSINVSSKTNYTAVELLNQVLEAGTTIQSSGNNMTLVVSGVEVVL